VVGKSRYQVEGEIGRFSFALHNVYGSAGEELFVARRFLPPRHGKQWYQTEGFKELGLFLGAGQSSYRKVQHQLNRWRRQEQEGTPLNTLRDGAEREGQGVLDFMGLKTGQVLSAHGFTPAGVPERGCETVAGLERSCWPEQSAHAVAAALEQVQAKMAERGLDETAQAAVAEQAKTTVFEQAEQAVKLSVDEIGVKRQKAQRDQARRSATPDADSATGGSHSRTRPKVQNAVARLEQAGRGMTLAAESVTQVLLFVLAFLLNAGLIKQRLMFFTDGERGLKRAIGALFCWHPAVGIILDWYHVVKKVKTVFSLALRGRAIRNRHLRSVVTLLWYGLVEQAVAHIESIPEDEIKQPTQLVKLVESLRRNRATIPCYALRAQLGLPNSSNPVERSNNLVTATRQKKKGMSWSKAGSHTLTALNVVVSNGHLTQWVKHRQIPFDFGCAA
jgi:hypothetical protein